MKRIFFALLLLFCFLFCINVYAQQTKYIVHTIAQGESLSLLAAKYHSTVGDLMRLNGMNSKSILNAGEKIKIPVKESKTKPATEVKASSPAPANNSPEITHFVLKGETLYSISKKFGITIDQLKKWNNLSDNHIHFGQQLAVTSEGAAIIANKYAAAPNAIDTARTEIQSPANVEKKQNFTDTIKQPDTSSSSDKSVSVNIVPSASTNANTQQAASASSVKESNDSYFATNFSSSAENKNLKLIGGDAMIFKTTSGWTDKKYYILMNEAPVGSIVKISSSNGNTIYAKVLWKLDDTKMNQGLHFRISEAAATALSIQDSKFNLIVQYINE